jgi:hypothetical protein
VSGYWDELQEEKVKNIKLESELSAAKAENEQLNQKTALLFGPDAIPMVRRMEAEIVRLREALEKISKMINYHGDKSYAAIAQSALDGKGGEA